jgi:hypothetical protein
MPKILKGVTYAYQRNIGWQDRTVRAILGTMALIGAIHFYPQDVITSAVLALLFLAQVVTVLFSRCMICYFMGACTITASEKRALKAKGSGYEN